MFRLSLRLMLILTSVSIFNGQENAKSVDYTSQNVIVSLEDVGLSTDEEILEDTEVVNRHPFQPFIDYTRIESNKTVANSRTEDNLNEEDIETRAKRTTASEENLPESNETIASIMQGNIHGGAFADIHDFPHSAFLTAYCNAKDDSDYWMCGASVLTQKHILTAAHCVFGCRGHFKIDILAGNENYEKAKVLREAKRLAYHKLYRDEGVLADIALLFLKKDLPLNNEIRRVWIIPSFPKRTEAYMAGWGVIDELGTMTTRLKVVTQNVWKQSKCLEYEPLEDGTICASSGSKEHYALRGDSGSALVSDNKQQQIGLVSYRDSRYPELIVYTNVSYYYDWLKDMVYTLSCN